jgi:excisionase family DNA binding protein
MSSDASDGSDGRTDLVRSVLASPDDPIYTEGEAAAYLKVSRRTLQRIRANGGVRYIEYVRKISYKKSFLDEYIAGMEMPAARVRRRRKVKK